jgi:hypothetical protein
VERELFNLIQDVLPMARSANVPDNVIQRMQREMDAVFSETPRKLQQMRSVMSSFGPEEDEEIYAFNLPPLPPSRIVDYDQGKGGDPRRSSTSRRSRQGEDSDDLGELLREI